MKYKEDKYKYKYISEDIANAFRYGFEEGEFEAFKSLNEDGKIGNKCDIIENEDHFEINGFMISKDNLGEPTSPNIIKNPEKRTPKDAPQAWEYIVDDESISSNGKYKGFKLFKKIFHWIRLSEQEAIKQNLYPTKVWLYNTLGAIEEVKYLGHKMPYNYELLYLFNSIPGEFKDKIELLKIPLIGYMDTDNKCKMNLMGESVYLLSGSHFENSGERSVFINNKKKEVSGEWFDCGHGSIVRPFLTKKNMPNNSNLLSKEKTTKQNRIWVRIASACNNKCMFCLDSYAHNGTFPKEEDVKKQIFDGYKKGFENRVIISGGEASINPKFVEYIKYAKSIGYDKVQTITNGNMYENLDFCKKIIDAGLDEITFSFHGHNPILHDLLVDTKGAFQKSLKGLLNIKKNFKNVIVNVDIVVNRLNVNYLRDIVRFFMKLGVYEFDILQIIPFGRGFQENKNKLFYSIEENIENLHDTWELAKTPGMYMWTNRFPAEAFEGYEDLIQDPRKIRSEVMGESYSQFEKFIESKGEIKPDCYGDACNYCFQKQYCHYFIDNQNKKTIENINNYYIVSGEEFPSQVYERYGKTKEDFIRFLSKIDKPIINIPKCLSGTGIYQSYNDLKESGSLIDYTEKYIFNFYRKKSLKCKKCKYFKECEGIHINFIRSYSFDILKPIID